MLMDMTLWPLKKTIKLLFSALFLSLCSCATQKNTSAEVFESVVVEKDPYEKTTTTTSPRFFQGNSHAHLENEVYHEAKLVCIQSDINSDEDIYLMVVFGGNSWAFLERAVDSDGRVLVTDTVSRDLELGGIREKIAIHVDRDYLKSKEDLGFDIQISGSRSKMILKYPGHYITGFLKAIQ